MLYRLSSLAWGLATLMAMAPATVCAQRGVQVNVDAQGRDILGDAANEPSLAVSPVDPQRIVIGWRQFDTVASDFRKAGYAYSDDGGVTWTFPGTLPLPPGFVNAGQTDPVLGVDRDGRFLYWSEPFNTTTSQHGMYLYESFDGGANWNIVGAAVPLTSEFVDKGWFTVDDPLRGAVSPLRFGARPPQGIRRPAGAGGAGDAIIHGCWTSGPPRAVTYSRSIDGGATWSPRMRVGDTTGPNWMVFPAVGPDGEVYLVWRDQNADTIEITKSVNAGNPQATPTFNAFGNGGFNGLDIAIDLGHDPIGMPQNPVGFHAVWAAVDRTVGPRRGQVYVLWADERNGDVDIYFARSTDGGFTWQTGIRVNDDPMFNGKDQWMAMMDIAADGRLDAAWYDCRNDPANWLSELYYASSSDGGLSWSANRRLSGAFDTTVGFPVQEKIGDYTQILSDETGAHIAYAATFTGGQDIYYVRVSADALDGDLDGDGDVDLSDFTVFQLCFGGSRNPPAPTCPPGTDADLDGDGDVDLADFLIFQQNFTGAR